MTKGKNKHYLVKRVRHLLNSNLEFFTKVSGHKLNAMGYGGGPHKSGFKDSSKDD
jgi:hypothetical protein